MNFLSDIPESYRQDIDRAVEILKKAGCTQVYLFGSAATGQSGPNSDIDLAIRGCPKGRFFFLLGQLMLELNHPVDLISLDTHDAFAHYLEQQGELLALDQKS